MVAIKLIRAKFSPRGNYWNRIFSPSIFQPSIFVLNLFFAFRTWQVLLGSNLKFVMADWDADDFEPDVTPAGGAAMPSDKWDGEDEDDDKAESAVFFSIYF